MDAKKLSISSLRFNQMAVLPDWVEPLLGAKSAFWKMKKEEDKRSLNTLQDGREAVINAAKLNVTAFSPLCSFEFLGFARVNSAAPFLLKFKHQQPSVGHGELSVGSLHWKCYYRATYDNWRLSEQLHKEAHFWPVFVYCPAPWTPNQDDTECSKLKDLMDNQDVMPATLQVNVQKEKWKIPFSMVHNAFDPQTHPMSEIVVCSSMPYVSSIPSKRDAVGAIFFEYLRYHSNLGLQVVVYDTTGKQRKYMFDAPYSKRQRMSVTTLLNMRNRVVYYDHSILGLLDPSILEVTFDNDESDTPAIGRLDDDHTYTLTHCRFDVAARWGVRNVLVTDFDEFIYCPSAPPTAKMQAQFLHRYIKAANAVHLDQLLLFQEVIYNRTVEGAAQCIRNQIALTASDDPNVDPSIFHCFAAHNKRHAAVQHKSLYLTATCPFNTDHHACSMVRGMTLADYDCLCHTTMASQCSVIHLGMHKPEQVSHGAKEDEEVRSSELEIRSVSNSEPVLWKISKQADI